MANYARERGKYGGMCGSIIVHSTPNIANVNEPTENGFKNDIPAGYLKCDGSVLNAKDYLALSQVLGVGSESRFRKENQTLREADASQGDLGQFVLPDLGSKVITGGRGTGIYNNYFVDDGTTESINNGARRVGPQVEVVSNFGNSISSFYIGNVNINPSGTLNFLGNPRYNIASATSETELDISNFQGHTHEAFPTLMNWSTQHEVGFQGGKTGGNLPGNSGGGHELGVASQAGTESIHKHNITRPTSYANAFTYTYPETQIDLTGVSVSVDVDTANIDKIDDLVTPFILVQYLIKF
jgi:hypothetical protein